MKKTLAICVLAILAISISSSAALVAVGDAVEGNSWTQGFNEAGVGNFDLVAVRMTSVGDSFESPTHTNFNRASWALLYEDDAMYPMIASATGPATTNMTWTIHFAGNKTDALAFDFIAFDGETIKEAVHTEWSGSNWSYSTSSWAPARADLVPEPATMALLGLGGLFFRKMKKA